MSPDLRQGDITRIAIASNSGCHPSPIASKRQPFQNGLTVNAHIFMAIHLSVNFQYIQSILENFTFLLFPWQRQPF